MDLRRCEVCGAVLVRREQERSPQWKRRRFCSRKCGAAVRRLTSAEQLAARQEARRAAWLAYYYRHREERLAAMAASFQAKRKERARIESLPPERRAEVIAMAEFLKRKGVTKCPPKYAAPTEHGSLDGKAAAKRLAAMPLPEHGTASWKRGIRL